MMAGIRLSSEGGTGDVVLLLMSAGRRHHVTCAALHQPSEREKKDGGR